MENTNEIAEYLRQYDEEIGFGITDLIDAIECEGGPEFLDAVAQIRMAQAEDAVYGFRLGTDEADQKFVESVRALVGGRP